MNWVVQSSAVDFLHLLIVQMDHLIREHRIRARLSISIHDEVRYLVAAPDAPRLALALHLSNLFARATFVHKLSMDDLPLSVAFFSSVDVDRVQRKEPSDDCLSPSCPRGIASKFGISPGQSWDIGECLRRTGGSLEA